MLNDKIKELRIDNDKYQKEIADYLKITKQQYSLYETGKRTIPVDLIIEISNYYNVSLDYITGRTKNKQINSKNENKEIEVIKKIIEKLNINKKELIEVLKK